MADLLVRCGCGQPFNGSPADRLRHQQLWGHRPSLAPAGPPPKPARKTGWCRNQKHGLCGGGLLADAGELVACLCSCHAKEVRS